MSDKETAEFKRFHQMLCERVGYVHDELHWKRDQLSLIEFIAAQMMPKEPGGLRECGACGWVGPYEDTLMLGSIGPLCPQCRETTEEVSNEG